MWLWIILALISLGNLSIASPEIISNEFVPEDVTGDDSLFLYMDERSFESPHRSEHRDIETRRRSALDKNFMRFGRSDPYISKYVYDTDDDDDSEDFSRNTRSHNENHKYLRFGRGKSSDFLRFGRDPYKYSLSRISRASKDKNFIRFGRSVPLKRSRRDAYSQENFNQQYKRGNNNRDMVRFGRRDNFLRFGRLPYDNNDTHESHDNSVMKQSENNDNKEKSNVHPFYSLPYHDSSLLQLLTELALKIRSEDKDAFSRIG